MKNKNLKNSDNWATPNWLLEKLENEFGSLFDPCPLGATFDGLQLPHWGPDRMVAFVNPPYSRVLKEAFIRKAVEEQRTGRTVVMLLPVSTSTKIFHECILPKAEIRFLKGRIAFKGYNTKGEYVEDRKPMHDSMICVFKGKEVS